MVNQKFYQLGTAPSVIRELFAYGLEQAQVVGPENVFDYSLGNPSIPAPAKVNQSIHDILNDTDSIKVHGYSMACGFDAAREAIAANLNRRFGMELKPGNLFLTCGAAPALVAVLRALAVDDAEFVAIAPYFPEYQPYVNGTGAHLTVVPADTENFQINFEAFEKALNPGTAAVLINTPNNPSGAVYSAETLTHLAEVLKAKQVEYGHDIFLIADEPYREIVFDGGEQPYPSKFYDNTLSCYSYSKSLSLPGERIGYVAVNPRATDAKLIVPMCGQISRGTGHNCPSSTAQLAVAKVVDETSDLSVYETNMNLLYDALTRLGFDVVRPGGTFYIFPKALEEDANAFCMKAKDYDLILVPSDSFGVPGYFRMAYCIDTEKVKRSIPVFEKFAHEVYGL